MISSGGSTKEREISYSSEITAGDSGNIECKESRAKGGVIVVLKYKND